MSVSAESNNETPDFTEPLTEEQKRMWHQAAMWALLIIGLSFVLFAGPLGSLLVPKTQYAPNSFQWNHEDVLAISATLRVIGCMAFAAGLVERIVIVIRNTRVAAVQQYDGSDCN